jgi:hypothetical protein
VMTLKRQSNSQPGFGKGSPMHLCRSQCSG